MRIQFINHIGLEEAGIDGGGIFKEFINEVLKTAFDPNRGFFLMTADNTLYPNPNVHLIVENFEEHFHFIGRLVGKVGGIDGCKNAFMIAESFAGNIRKHISGPSIGWIFPSETASW